MLEDKDINVIRETIRAVQDGTKVSVYDCDGDLVTFRLEDVISVNQDMYTNKVYITLEPAKAVSFNRETKTAEFGNTIRVVGTETYWKNRLGINNVPILNDFQE
jgi:hypothetical protein